MRQKEKKKDIYYAKVTSWFLQHAVIFLSLHPLTIQNFHICIIRIELLSNYPLKLSAPGFIIWSIK